MLKRLFVLAVMAIVFFIKPSFVNANTEVGSEYAEAESFANGTSSQSRSSVSCNRRKLFCRKNEVMSNCIQRGCQPKTCSDLDRDIPCIRINRKFCKRGCLCKKGYLRADNGTCVPISSCTLKCTRPNELFVRCPPTCPPQTCDSINKRYNCPLIPIPINITNCRPACRCQPNYYKNKIKACISKDDCLKCTGPNEFFSCGGACDNVCDTLSEQNQTNCPIINIVCNKMCYCEKGYARDKNNICIPIDKCKESQCPANEKYVQCPSLSCTPQSCSQLGFPLNCTGLTINAKCREKPGCICIDGYVRNNKGVCIPKNDCPSCGGDNNAEPGCGVNCGRRCSDYFHKGPVACPDICILNGCQCKSGKYYDDVLKKCVDPNECTPICNKNEIVSSCINGGCDKRNCSQINDEKICINPLICKKGCVCAKGYLRHPNGTCVPINKCPPVCGKNEVYTNCTENVCKAVKCSQLGFPLKCSISQTNICTEGCVCKDGYLRAANGTCIPASSCPSCGGDVNAVSGCGINCNRRCSNIGQEPQFCIALCKNNACDCKEGFYLDDNTGKCVLSQDCSTCGGDPNAKPGCSFNCNKQCTDIGVKRICPRIACPPNGCECKDGFYFDNSTKKCVSPEKCAPGCGKDEIYSDCIQGQCTAKNCADVGIPIACPRIDPKFCIKGCLCKDGYARAENGICIPKKDCPSCGGDPNAVAGCGVNCNKKCSDIGKKEQSCTDICNENGCDCKDGYYYDDNTKKCVRPKNCTATCGENEVYSDCIQGQCGPKTCSQIGVPVPCALIDSKSCIKGCICKNGYVRDSNKICIPQNKCNNTCGGDPNAEPGCGLNCNKQCSDIGVKRICPRIACPVNGCECKDGFYFDTKINKCVLPKNCPPPSTTTSTTPKSTTTEPQSDIETALADIRKGNVALCGELLYQLVQSKPGVSFVTSALSALIPFAELTLYASGLTLEQLLRLLNVKSKDEIMQGMPVLLNSFQGQQNVTFEIANKVYANKNYPLTDTFKQQARTLFNSEAENLDFANAVESANTINQWVANKTNDLIQNLIPSDMLDANTEVVLVNVLYFLGNWVLQFNPNNTKNRDFYITPNKTKSLPIMYQQAMINYAEDSNLNAQIIELFYKGRNFSLVVWLPKTIDGLSSMVEKLQDPNTFTESMNSFSSEMVEMYIPKMNIETDIDFVDVLQKDNVTQVFEACCSQLNGIVTSNKTLYVSDAIQKAVLKVDETGTEVAVATAVGVRPLSLPLPPPVIQVFKADHPFVFCIKYQTTLISCGVFQ